LSHSANLFFLCVIGFFKIVPLELFV
jgi:hypothetical protein